MVTDDNGKEAADLRIYAWEKPKGTMSLGIMDPLGSWGKAGLHTNDQLVSMDGRLINNYRDYRSIIEKIKLGDTVQVEVKRSGSFFKTAVIIRGYNVPVVNISVLANATPAQKRLADQWILSL